MDPLVKKSLLFFLICIPVRAFIVWWATQTKKQTKPNQWLAIGIITATIGLGFLYQHFSGSRKTGAFGEKVYWNRPLHGTMYLVFAALWFLQIPSSYTILAIDLIIGLFTFILHYY